MVKADAKHDYYADLEVPPTADAEAIKKQFRILAKQYHPDRNPGKETEVVAKFQAVQAAHEILSDLQQKSKYDADRAKYIRKTDPDPYGFKRAYTARPAPPPPAPPFPPPRPRNASVDRSQFTGSRPQQPSSTSAERFAAFTRAGPQHWDRSKFEDATAKAEALRNFQSMRGNPPPQRAARAPTAPRPASTVTSPEFTHATAPSPGFPGLSRTNSGHHRTGFSPSTAGRDEPPAKSAYAYVHSSRDKGPQPTGYSYQPHPPPQSNPTSPQAERSRPSGSPLRQSKSSQFDEYQRPPLGRVPSRYAASSGEKTNINGFGLGRSASVQNSPVEKRFSDHGPFGVRDQSSQEFRPPPPPPPRNHSASPKLRSENGTFEYSASESSSSEDERSRQRTRPKATPRQARKPQQPQRGRPNASNDPALTGHFSNKNYTRLVEESQYNFPPPETSNSPHRKPFEDMTSPVDNKPSGWNDAGTRSQSSEGSHLGSHSNPHLNGTSNSVPPTSSHHHTSSFSASEWDGKFSNGDNVFVPNERDRKSPTKTTRSKTTSRTRSYHTDIGADDDSEDISPTMPEPRKVHSYESPSKAAAFPPGKFFVEDWSEKIKSENANQPTHTAEQEVPSDTAHTATEPGDANATQPSGSPDAMDIDSNQPSLSAQTMPPPETIARRLSATTPNVSATHSRRPSDGGVSLADLANTAPFKASAEGLDSLASDLAGSLPFKSRAADQVQLAGPSGAALRNMSLPKPPKPIIRPEKITQDTWETYSKRMQQYMRDWGAFNAKMIEHFRIRQEQVNHKMYQNWVMGEGEGANAHDVDDGTDIISPPVSAGADSNRPHPKAGYLTYMQWLEQDALCRRWWDMAFEEHRECLDGLGSMRRAVKAVRDQEETGS